MSTTTLSSSTTGMGHQAMVRSLAQMERGADLFVVLIVILIISWIFVFLRAYVRYFMIKHIAADDWWMFAAMIAYTGYGVEALYGIVYGGTGRHMDDLTVEQIYIGLKTWYISEILYAPVSAMVRTSVALFLLRVSVSQYHKWIILANLSVIYIVTIAFMFVVTFQCDPPSYFYDQVLGLEGHCMEITVVPRVTIIHSAICAVCDLVFAWLPIAILWDVKLNKRTKVVIAVLLGMGSIAGIALLVRIPFIKVLAVSPDFLYETIDVAIWSVLEPSLGIMAGCLATMRPLFKGFGIGRNTTRGYLDKYIPPSSRFGRSHDDQRNLRANNLGDGISLQNMDLERASLGLDDYEPSTHSSLRPLNLHLEPCTSPKPSVKTNIMSKKDSSAARQPLGFGSQPIIAVHTCTTIRSESLYEGAQREG